jgi:tetratricopeptide (TPR) repeat protein
MQDYEPAMAYCQQAHAMATALGDGDLQALVNQDMGQLYWELGDYRQAIAYLQQTLTAIQGVPPDQSFGGIVLPSVQARVLMVVCLSELGTFADGVAYGDEALQIAEVVGRPFERLAVYSRVGSLHVRPGYPGHGHPTARTGGGLGSGRQHPGP